MHGKTVERIFMIHLAHCSQYANEMGREIWVIVEPGQYLISLGGRRKEQSALLNFIEYSFHSVVLRISTGLGNDSNVGEFPVLCLSSFQLGTSGSRNFCWWNSWNINAGQQMLFANLCIRPFSHKNCKLLTLPKLNKQSRIQERLQTLCHLSQNRKQNSDRMVSDNLIGKVSTINLCRWSN